MYGDSLQNHCVIIVVPSQAEVNKFQASGATDVLNNSDFKKLVLDDINRLLTNNHCTSLEKPKNIHLMAEPFSIENDILTPTYKIKRNAAKLHFQKEIDRMYEELNKQGL